MVLYQSTCTGTLVPNYHACTDAVSQALPYCDTTLSFEDRLRDLMSTSTHLLKMKFD